MQRLFKFLTKRYKNGSFSAHFQGTKCDRFSSKIDSLCTFWGKSGEKSPARFFASFASIARCADLAKLEILLDQTWCVSEVLEWTTHFLTKKYAKTDQDRTKFGDLSRSSCKKAQNSPWPQKFSQHFSLYLTSLVRKNDEGPLYHSVLAQIDQASREMADSKIKSMQASIWFSQAAISRLTWSIWAPVLVVRGTSSFFAPNWSGKAKNTRKFLLANFAAFLTRPATSRQILCCWSRNRRKASRARPMWNIRRAREAFLLCAAAQAPRAPRSSPLSGAGLPRDVTKDSRDRFVGKVTIALANWMVKCHISLSTLFALCRGASAKSLSLYSFVMNLYLRPVYWSDWSQTDQQKGARTRCWLLVPVGSCVQYLVSF